MNLTPLSVVVDDVWGEKGTPREGMQWKLSSKKICRLIILERLSEAERLRQNLTQEELGAKVGVENVANIQT